MSGPSLEDVLAGRGDDDLRAFHGFGGLHGGLLAATLLRSAQSAVADDAVPIEVTTQVLRPVVAAPRTSSSLVHRGRAVTVAAAHAQVEDAVAATAVATFTGRRDRDLDPTFAPTCPVDVARLDDAEPFVVPPEFVPISTRMEIRPATAALPYSGAGTPELCAWVRLTEPVADPWERLLILADALAPSYAAVLSDLRLVPTVRMTVRFTPAAATEQDWVLVRATTTEAQADGWLTETIDIWDRAGVLLATAGQLRLVR